MAFRSILTISLAASTLALAAPQISNGQNCPEGWSYNGGNSVGGTELPGYCCPGSSDIDGTMQYCVVGSSTVPVTAAGYTSIVSSLLAKESGSGNSGGATFIGGSDVSSSIFISAGPSGTTTMGSVSSGSGAIISVGPSGTSTGVVTAASSSSSSSSSGGAAMVTAAPMLGAAALALLVL